MKSEKRISSRKKKKGKEKCFDIAAKSHTDAAQIPAALTDGSPPHSLIHVNCLFSGTRISSLRTRATRESTTRLSSREATTGTHQQPERREATAGSHFRSSLSLVSSPSSSRLSPITDLLHLLRDRTSYHGPIDQKDRHGSVIIHDQRQS